MDGYNFTNASRAALQDARTAAAERGHEYVGTEHMLIGLLHDRNGAATAALRKLGVEPDALVAKIDSVIKRGNSSRRADAELPYTSRGKKVLELAMMSARDHQRSDVDPILLLHGLIRERVGIAAQVLTDAGVSSERLIGPGDEQDGAVPPHPVDRIPVGPRDRIPVRQVESPDHATARVALILAMVALAVSVVALVLAAR